MTTSVIMAAESRVWWGAGAVAATGHMAAAALLMAWPRQPEPPVPEPVVLLELPPISAPQQAVEMQPSAESLPPAVSQAAAPQSPIAAPLARTPMPSDPVQLPPAAAQPQFPPASAAPAAAAPPASTPVLTALTTGAATDSDPRAKKQQADYFALLSAHLNRRKIYPAEARQARQQGVVVVRFTVDRNGNVEGVSIKRGSGHAILDAATLALVQRVAPLPRMPASMQRDRLTLALPIDYALRTD